MYNMGLDSMPELNGTTWWSRDGKNHFTIRDVIMDPAQGIIIMTTDGRQFDDRVLDTYIQSDTPIRPTDFNPYRNKPTKQRPKVEIGDISEPSQQSVSDDDLLKEDMNLIYGVEDIPTAPESAKPITSQKSGNYDIIDKALNKVKEPNILLDIKWDEYPSREFELLHDIMNISNDEIAEYCFIKWFSRDKVEMILKQQIAKLLGGV